MDEMRYQLDLLKAMNQKLTGTERMYRLVCDTSSSAFLYYSFERNEARTLGRWDEIFDFDIKDAGSIAMLYDIVEEAYAVPLREALYVEKNGGDEAAVECSLRDRKMWLRFTTRVIYENGAPTDKIVKVDNITKSRIQNEELEYMAFYDEVTGLHNRNYFVRVLTEYLTRAQRENNIVSVMVIDIDDFRKINDGMGMMVGDELVQVFGSFLKELCGEGITACRISSDVYCIALYNPMGCRSVEAVCRAIQNRIKSPFRLSSGQDITITVSIGVAEFPEAARTALELIGFAEIVMYKGKAMGKNTIQYFDTPILNDFLNSIEMENKLKEAVFNNSFVVYYQPQFYAGNRKLRGAEALVRWRDAEQGLISPAAFIPIAEKNGSIISIGGWVVEESIRQYAKWREEYGMGFIVSINISSLQYKKDDFVQFILNVLKKYQVSPAEIELEITESILIEDFEEVSRKLKLLREYGIRTSLDDFGTGFSSLSYLRRLPIDTLKIDKSFIDAVLTDSATRIITESILNMAHALGFETVAEGVEEEQQYQYLHASGCDIIQGFLFGKPQPAEEFEGILQKSL